MGDVIDPGPVLDPKDIADWWEPVIAQNAWVRFHAKLKRSKRAQPKLAVVA